MYQLINTFIGGDLKSQLVSQHKSLQAAIKANIKLQRQVKKANGSTSYLPTKILENWQPVNEEEYDAALTVVHY